MSVERKELGERKAAVLRAVVEEYVRTGEPVGSETVAENAQLGVSPATIRNELAALEDMGYLGHPHTSAGRVPTDLGYRLFVNALPNTGRLRDVQRRAITDFFAQTALDLEDVLLGATQLLSRLTQYAGLAVAPSAAEERVVHVEFVPIGGNVLALIVGQHGRVDKRVLDRPDTLDEGSLALLSSTVGQLVGGLTVAQAKERVGELKGKRAAAEQDLLAALADEFDEMLAGTTGDHMLVHGVANLAGEAAQWHLETTQRLVEALERESEMLTLLREAGTQDLSVMIGGEHPSTEQWDASVIAAPYRAGETSLGAIGIVGPTRMDYLTAINAVKAVARRISAVATEQEG